MSRVGELDESVVQAIGAVGIVLGILTCVIPFLGAMGSCGPLVSAVCDDRCDGYVCDDDTREASCLEFRRNKSYIRGSQAVILKTVKTVDLMWCVRRF